MNRIFIAAFACSVSISSKAQLPSPSFVELLHNDHYPLQQVDSLNLDERLYYLQFMASHPNDSASAQARKIIKEQSIMLLLSSQTMNQRLQLEDLWIWPLTQQVDTLNYSFIDELRQNWRDPYLIDFMGRCVRTPHQAKQYAQLGLSLTQHFQLDQWNTGCFYLLRNGQFQEEIQQTLIHQFLQIWSNTNQDENLVIPHSYWQAISRIPKSKFNAARWKILFNDLNKNKYGKTPGKFFIQVLGRLNEVSFHQQMMHWATDRELPEEIRLECLLQLQRNHYLDSESLMKIVSEKHDYLSALAIKILMEKVDYPSVIIPFDWQKSDFRLSHPEMFWSLVTWQLKTTDEDPKGKELWRTFIDTANPYDRMRALPALPYRKACLQNLQSFLTSPKATYTDLYYGTELLIAQAVVDSNSTFWKEEAIQIWETNDMGAQALLAAGVKEVKLLQDLKLKWRILMEKRLTTLQLPAEVETYNEIARALSSLFSEQKSSYPDHQPKPRISIDQRQWESLQFHREYEMQVDIHGDTHNIHFFVQELDHPITAMHFKSLVQNGFYDNKHIHRYVPNFVSQGGCPRGDGMGSLDSVIPSEFTEDSFTLGHIGWASAGPHTESCQIFFMTSDAPHLDGRYTNMGAVYNGEEWLSKMTIGTKINWIKLIP